MEKEKYFIIDVCGTLYRSNTTMDFIKFHYSGKRWFQVLQKLRANRIYAYVNYLLFRISGIDLTRIIAIHHLKGLTKEEISNMANRFYNEYLLKIKNEDVFDIIEDKRKNGLTLVIVSATLDCISKIVAENLGVKRFFSSELEYDNNDVCVGKLRSDLLGSKLKKLISERIIPPYAGIITDNYSDADILSKTNYAHLVLYGNNIGKWHSILKKFNCDYKYVTIS